MPELPHIVRARLKASRPTAAHPDADVLTAFTERALPESEGAVVAEHLARCHDCRDILALALPATVTAKTAGAPLPVRGGWLRVPMLRWGVVAAGLAVLAVGGLLQYQRRHVAQTFIAAREATAPVPEPLTAQASHGEESVRPTPGAAATSPNAAPANASGVNAISAIPRDADTTFKKKRAAVVPRASFGAPVKQSVQLNAAPSSAGGAETQSQLVATDTSGQAANQPFEYRAMDQNKDRGQAGVGGRASMDVTVDKAKAPEMTTVEVSSAAPSSSAAPLALRWAISDAGRLLRSFDQGRTWASVDLNASFPVASQMVVVVPQSQKYQQTTPDASLQGQSQAQVQSPAQKQSETKSLGKSRVAAQRAVAASVSIPVFRAVSAAGLEVWAGGSAGVLYHSVNGGERWTRVVPSASGTLLTGDVIAIAFSDPQHGQLTTSTQELWTTFDAGQTWQKR
jgi:photosystem II stability/assembly factor-like uncharacterized protein